jgi:intein-encoded DNA endonuclease-like protein
MSNKIGEPITEHDAYFAGLIFADGYFQNLEKSWRTSIRLEMKDRNIVKAFCRWVGASSITHRHSRGENQKDKFRTGAANDSAFRFLDNHGVVSKVQVSPVLAHNKHFWRGFIDGDGSLTIREYTPSVRAWNNSPVILEQLRAFHECFENCSVRRRNRCYSIEAKSNSAGRFVVELYAGASVYLDRKIETAHKIAELNGS